MEARTERIPLLVSKTSNFIPLGLLALMFGILGLPLTPGRKGSPSMESSHSHTHETPAGCKERKLPLQLKPQQRQLQLKSGKELIEI